MHLLEDIQQNYVNEPVQVIANRHGVKYSHVVDKARDMGVTKRPQFSEDEIWRMVKRCHSYTIFREGCWGIYQQANKRGMLPAIREYFGVLDPSYRRYENGYIMMMYLDGCTINEMSKRLSKLNRRLKAPKRTWNAVRHQKNKILKNMPELILK